MNQRIEKLIKELDQEETLLLAQLKEVRDVRSKLSGETTSTKPTWNELVEEALKVLGSATATQVAIYIADKNRELKEAEIIKTIRFVLSDNANIEITTKKEGRSSLYKLKKAS